MRVEPRYPMEEFEVSGRRGIDEVEAMVSVKANDGMNTVGMTKCPDVTDHAAVADIIREQIVSADEMLKDIPLSSVSVTLSVGRVDNASIELKPDEEIMFDGTVEEQLSQRMVDEMAEAVREKAALLVGE